MSSKLGVFFQGPPELGTEATELVRSCPGMVVKGIDPDKWHAPPHEIFPENRVIARLWIGGDQIEHEYMARGEEGARDYFDLMAPRYEALARQGVLDFCGPNEPHPNEGNWRAYEEFEYWWARIISHVGSMRPWVWSFGGGWPGLLEGGDTVPVRRFADSIEMAYSVGGGLELHEYGAPEVLSGDGWLTLRYRKVIEELASVLLMPDNSILVGECGIDRGVMGTGGFGGWQTFSGWIYPEGECGLPAGGMTEGRYWCQMAAYDDELLKDAQVLGATPFVTCPTDKWQTFDWGGGLIRRAVEKHGGGPVPPTPEECHECACYKELLARIQEIERWRGDVGPLDTRQAFGESFVVERLDG